MGFSTQNQGTSSPAKRRYGWSGGEHLAEGKYRFSYYDFETKENVEVKLPFEAWFLENTIGIGGGGDGYYYWTNEAAPAGYDTPGSTMVLHKTTFAQDGSRISEELARGTYAQIKKVLGYKDKNGKETLPPDMRFVQNYYFLNPSTKEIEAIRMQGSMNSAFINFTNQNRGWGQKKTLIELNEELKHRGSVYYYEPKFSIRGDYTPEELELMQKADKEVLDYIKSLYGRDGQESSDPSIDQTPASYEGEQSQETPVKENEDGQVDLSDVPFL